MNSEIIFRILFAFFFMAMMTIRVFFQSKVLRDKRRIEIKEDRLSLIAGSIAALIAIVFGAEYLFCPGSFSFAYVVRFPDWLRWLGVFILGGGVTLLGLSHHHLGRSFHSLVVSKENHELVKTGPYQWIRHSIYTAYLMNYIGGGLLSSNWILTIGPVSMYAILVGKRMGKEEEILQEEFGQDYNEYMERTGRLLPRIKRRS